MSEATSPEIRIDKFDAWYGDFQALQGITATIAANHVTALIGPSGCGKSTLLKWINRMNDLVPSARCAGTLTIGDLNALDRATDAAAEHVRHATTLPSVEEDEPDQREREEEMQGGDDCDQHSDSAP